MSLLLLLLVCLVPLSQGVCPTSTLISPCTCREEMPGRTLDCASITSGSQLAGIMQNDLGETHFDFFQAIKSSGAVSLDSLPANTFGGKTLTHIWIGENSLASVDDAAFSGLEPMLMEILLGASPSLTSFPYASLASLPLLFKLQITASGLTSVSSFGDAPQLGEIKLTNGAISSVAAGSFNDLPNLTMVDLSGNSLTSLEDGAYQSSSTQVWSLYLESNGITAGSSAAFGGVLPLLVSLRFNSLTTVDEASFGDLVNNMATFDPDNTLNANLFLTGNPIVCDCGLSWFATDPSKLAHVKGAVCANDDVAGTAVEDLPADFFGGC